MTREEAYNRIDAIIAKYEIDDEYVTITNFKDYDALRIAREILEQEPKTDVLDKIRAEFISLYPRNYAGELELGGVSCVFSLNKVLNVIDKYKAESEG